MANKKPAQNTPTSRTCGTMQVHERMLRTVAGYRETRDAIETHAWRSMFSPIVGRSGCTKIPVVVHVVYKTAAQNISDAQIKSQIGVLNADFRKQNADVGNTPAPFAPLAADARIQFELAKIDPSGNPTTGITRTRTTKDSFSDDDGVKSATSGGVNAWPRDKYLNIWVCQLGGGLLGYAQFPGGPANTDGVVILHSGFGTTGTAAAPFNLGRTATHEIGHWLNLRHIWGDDGSGCSGSDFVADTPNQAGPNTGTPGFPRVTCGNGPNGDMFMNYMDYTDDAGMFMFTAGQVTRMQAALDGARSTIGVSVPCAKTSPKDLPKDIPKDLPKDLPKDPPKDFPKDPPKDTPKDGHKDSPKDLPKDFHKDFPKDWHKDVPKDGHKDFPKEVVKEFHKEFHKELPSDVPGNKPLPNDLPPKVFQDPPKLLFEPPIDFTPPIFPGLPGGGGGLPFVLGTPGGRVGDCGCKDGGRQQGGTLVSVCVQLMSQFARLHEQGQLDATGQAAWQQVTQLYQQLAASSGTGS